MKRLRGTEAGIRPASYATRTDYRAHGAMIAALPDNMQGAVDDDDDETVWIETIATSPVVVGIPHDVMVEILGITLEAWLALADDIDHDPTDDDWFDELEA